MADTFSEVSGKSWLGRIGESIKSVLFGVVLFAVSFILLFWNEGRAVTTARSLEEGAHTVVNVDNNAIKPENEGKLIHFCGTATAKEELRDAVFQVAATVLKLQRKVEMYQWVEEKKSETHKKLGGGEETVTTYTYNKQWAEEWNDSSKFKQASDHVNPPKALASQSQVQPNIMVGAFKLSATLVEEINNYQPLELPAGAPATVAGGFAKNGDGYYCGVSGGTVEQPHVGDLRVNFRVVKPQEVSVVAQQSGSTVGAYPTKAGRSLEMLELGTVTAAQMFKAAQDRNANLTWILRLVGFLAMWIGLMMVFNPLKVLADVVPFFGSLVGAGLMLVTLCVALPLSLLTIAVAWMFYRPLLSIILLVVAGAAAFGIWKLIQGRKGKAVAAAA